MTASIGILHRVHLCRSKQRAEIDRHQQHAGSCSRLHRHKTEHGVIRFGTRHQIQFVNLHQREEMGTRTFQLAKRVWCVFVWHSQIGAVVKNIEDQEKHHAQKTFKEEYLEVLRKFNVEYDAKYLSERIEDM